MVIYIHISGYSIFYICSIWEIWKEFSVVSWPQRLSLQSCRLGLRKNYQTYTQKAHGRVGSWTIPTVLCDFWPSRSDRKICSLGFIGSGQIMNFRQLPHWKVMKCQPFWDDSCHQLPHVATPLHHLVMCEVAIICPDVVLPLLRKIEKAEPNEGSNCISGALKAWLCQSSANICQPELAGRSCYIAETFAPSGLTWIDFDFGQSQRVELLAQPPPENVLSIQTFFFANTAGFNTLQGVPDCDSQRGSFAMCLETRRDNNN